MLRCFLLCQISTTKQQCVTYVTPFHITATQFPNQNPPRTRHTNPLWTHQAPWRRRQWVSLRFLSLVLFSCHCWIWICWGFFCYWDYWWVLSPLSHRHRAEADLSPLSATWNEQDGKVLWVTKQRGLGFSRFIWNRF